MSKTLFSFFCFLQLLLLVQSQITCEPADDRSGFVIKWETSLGEGTAYFSTAGEKIDVTKKDGEVSQYKYIPVSSAHWTRVEDKKQFYCIQMKDVLNKALSDDSVTKIIINRQTIKDTTKSKPRTAVSGPPMPTIHEDDDGNGVTFDFTDSDGDHHHLHFTETDGGSLVTIGPTSYSITSVKRDDKIQWMRQDTITLAARLVFTEQLKHDIMSDLGMSNTITIAGYTVQNGESLMRIKSKKTGPTSVIKSKKTGPTSVETWWVDTLRLEPPTDDIKQTIVNKIVNSRSKKPYALKKSFCTKYYDTILPLLIKDQSPNQLLFVTAVEELRTMVRFEKVKAKMHDIYDIFFGNDKMPLTEVSLPSALYPIFEKGKINEWEGQENPWKSPWTTALANAYKSVRQDAIPRIKRTPEFKKAGLEIKESGFSKFKKSIEKKMKKTKKSKETKIKSKTKPGTESQVAAPKSLLELMGGTTIPKAPKAFSEYDDIYDDIYDEIYYDNMQSYANHIGYQKEILNNNNNNNNYYSIEWILFAMNIFMLLLVICCVIGIIGSVIGYFGGHFMNKNNKNNKNSKRLSDVITFCQSDNQV